VSHFDPVLVDELAQLQSRNFTTGQRQPPGLGASNVTAILDFDEETAQASSCLLIVTAERLPEPLVFV
jgi:hypothetical protein